MTDATKLIELIEEYSSFVKEVISNHSEFDALENNTERVMTEQTFVDLLASWGQASANLHNVSEKLAVEFELAKDPINSTDIMELTNLTSTYGVDLTVIGLKWCWYRVHDRDPLVHPSVPVATAIGGC